MCQKSHRSKNYYGKYISLHIVTYRTIVHHFVIKSAGTALALVEGQESGLCEALKLCWSFLQNYYVIMKGP